MKSEKSAPYLGGLYLRLSEKDRDAGDAPSESIQNQRMLLENAAKAKGILLVDVYIDDGYSGTSFDRPAFRRMIQDIEIGRINTVLTKDLSRFGRNYSEAGYYQEVFFPEHGVRYIAVLDGYDSCDEYTTSSAPWLNVANEQYARDLSKKIRGAFQAKMESGQFVGNFAPYGYRKDPQNKNHLLIDETAAAVVRTIFEQLAGGVSPAQIAAQLNARGILPPLAYRNLCLGRSEKADSSNGWTPGSVSKVSRNEVYLGRLIHHRQRKVSYKSRVCLPVPKEQWIVNQQCHEALVSQELFSAAQKARASRKRTSSGAGFTNVFSGVAFCADCGKALSTAPTRRWQEGEYRLVCGRYKLYGSRGCSNHFTNDRHLKKLVYDVMTCQLRSLSESDWEKLGRAVEARLTVLTENRHASHQEARRLREAQSEIDRAIEHLYEDRLSGRLTDGRFDKLLRAYEDRQTALSKQEEALRSLLPPFSEQGVPCTEETRDFAQLARSMLFPDHLTRELICAFVERIDVHQGHYGAEAGRKEKRQRIVLRLRFSPLQRFQ